MRATPIIEQVEGIPERYNAHCLSIKDVFAGEWDKALLSNYMYEWPWLLDQLPILWTLPCLAVYGDTRTAEITDVRAYVCTYACIMDRHQRACVHTCVWLLAYIHRLDHPGHLVNK